MVRLFAALLSCFIVTLTASSAAAQTGNSNRSPVAISGTILDPSGASIPTAEVTITDAAGARAVVHADAAGRFALNPPGSGPFVITVVMKGFAPAVEADVDAFHDL